MSWIGDEISGFDDEFRELLEEPLEVTNFAPDTTSAAPDEFDGPTKPTPTADSPIQTHGTVHPPSSTSSRANPWGMETDIDAEILVPDDLVVYEASDDAVDYASEVYQPQTDRTFIVMMRYDEGNGRQFLDVVNKNRHANGSN